jgi:RimJ/RimL family protein N-acetyltransferase
MHFNLIDYPAQYECEIETWCDESAIRFALDGDSIKSEHQWYFDNYTYNSDYFCKIILDGETPVALLMLAIWNEAKVRFNENFVYFDTLIINPAIRNQGYGTRIVIDIMKNIGQLIGSGDNVFIAQIHKENEISNKLAAKLGFHLVYTDSDPWFDWIYPDSAAEHFLTLRSE